MPANDVEAGTTVLGQPRHGKRIPRFGFANPYKRKEKACEAAEILTEIHRDRGWSYIVVEYEAAPPTWVILRETEDRP